MLPLLNTYARVPVCGLIAQYSGPSGVEGVNLLEKTMREVLTKSLTLRGFINTEFAAKYYASFCEWTDTRPKVTNWFALDESRPLFAFAGIWRLRTGERKGETRAHQLFSFLTTEANEVVRPIHAKAMSVLVQRFRNTTHIRRPHRFCRTKCGRLGVG